MLDIIRANPSISLAKITELTAIPRSSIERLVRKLKAKGCLQRKGPDRGGKWQVLERN